MDEDEREKILNFVFKFLDQKIFRNSDYRTELVSYYFSTNMEIQPLVVFNMRKFEAYPKPQLDLAEP